MKRQDYLEQLLNNMSQLKRFMQTNSQDSFEDRMATMMQFHALKFLTSADNPTVGDLATHLQLSKSSTTQLVERLEKAHCIVRFHDRDDRRIVRLLLTPEGKEQVVLHRKKILAKMETIFSKIPEHDLQELVRIHSNIITILQNEK